MGYLKIYRNELKLNILSNIKKSMKTPMVIVTLLAIIAVNLIIYVGMFDWSDDDLKKVGYAELGIVAFNIVVICIFFRTKTFLTYLYFIFAFKFVLMAIVAIATDTHTFGFVHKVEKITKTITYFFQVILVMMIVGFTFTNALILPIVCFLGVSNFIEAKITVRIKKPKKRIAFFIAWHLLFLAFLVISLNFIQYIEEEEIYKVFISYLEKAGLSKMAIQLIASPIYFILSKSLFIIWFTVLLKLNSYRQTDIYLRNSWMIGLASSVLFISYQLQFYNEHQFKGDIIAVPGFILMVATVFLLRSLLYFYRTVKANWKKAKNQDERYIPLVFSDVEKENLLIQAHYYHLKIKKENNEATQIIKTNRKKSDK